MDIKKEIQNYLSTFSSYQSEFHQAVHEVAQDLIQNDLIATENDLLRFKRLIEPDRVIRFKVEWMDDNNQIQLNRAWRVQFNNLMGPYKGGLRFHPSVDESILKFLGFEQIFKNALTGLPMGGAKGGSDFNPKGKSEGEIMRFCQAFIEELQRYIGKDRDIPAGDIGVGTREIGYMYGHYLKLSQQYTGSMTGKHPNFGGSCGREEATGYGCAFILKEFIEDNNDSLENKTALLSGAGNVALYAAEKLIKFGVKVLTVSDSDGYLYFEEGMSQKQLDEIMKLKFENRARLSEYKNATEYIAGKKTWEQKADIVMPCATQNELNKDEVDNLLASTQYIVEGANMPLTAEAIQKVEESEVYYIPSKAANAGGVAVSGIERTQNSSYKYLSKSEVENRLKDIMQNIYSHCRQYSTDQYSLKSGANIYSYQKIIKTMKSLRG